VPIGGGYSVHRMQGFHSQSVLGKGGAGPYLWGVPTDTFGQPLGAF